MVDYLPETVTLTFSDANDNALPTNNYLKVYSDLTTGTMDWVGAHDDRKYSMTEPQLTRLGWGYGGWGLGGWGGGFTEISVVANISIPGLWQFGVAMFDFADNQGDNGSVTETYQTPQPKPPGDWGTTAASYTNPILTVDL